MTTLTGFLTVSKIALGDAAYDSEKVRQMAEQTGIFFISPINPRDSKRRKDAYGRMMPSFLRIELGKWLFRFLNTIEQTFNRLKNDGLEQPRWYGGHRYLLHVQLCLLIHNFESLTLILQHHQYYKIGINK